MATGTLALAGDLVFRLVSVTARIQVHGAEHVEQARGSFPGLIFSLWHGRLLLGALAHRGRGTAIMISRHGDGEIIARIVTRHGYRAVRGSTTRGGGSAFRDMVRLAGDGVTEFAFTPDGPRGPRHVAQPGVVQLAAETGYAIIPSSASAKPAWSFDSWDRFLLPAPFARIQVVYGPAIAIDREMRDADLEGACARVGSAMKGVEAEADRRAGW